jgi:hypothetical protein
MGNLNCRGQVHGARKERIIIIIITRYDYNLTIMKSPKPATDTIYPHIKFWWYRTMLNLYPPFLCRVLATILKMADILKILKMQNCSSNVDLSICQNYMNLSTADLRNYRTEFHETWWSYRYMFLVDPKVFRFVVKGVKAIFLGVQMGWGLL